MGIGIKGRSITPQSTIVLKTLPGSSGTSSTLDALEVRGRLL
jgi:hypothetical protein